MVASPSQPNRNSSSNGVFAIPTSPEEASKFFRICLIAGSIALAALVSWGVYLYTWYHPTTSSGTIEANVVHASSLVGGRVIELPIMPNQYVKKGDLLYKIQPEPYQYALAQAESAYDFAVGQLEQVERDIRAQQAHVTETTASQAEILQKRDYAARLVKRLKPLADKNYISRQEYDQAKTDLAEAEADLLRSQGLKQNAVSSVTTLHRARAKVDQAKADLDLARWNLSQTTVYASVPGYITSLNIKEGEILSVGQPLFTLVDDSRWYAIANIREINLRPITEGECATVYSMINRHQPMRGFVESIGHGVSNDYISAPPSSIPALQRTMDWVHISQRFPVRIRVTDGDPNLLRMGATSIIQIGRGAGCRSGFKAPKKFPTN